jgi:hypothetical protein
MFRTGAANRSLSKSPAIMQEELRKEFKDVLSIPSEKEINGQIQKLLRSDKKEEKKRGLLVTGKDKDGVSLPGEKRKRMVGKYAGALQALVTQYPMFNASAIRDLFMLQHKDVNDADEFPGEQQIINKINSIKTMTQPKKMRKVVHD